MRLEARGQPYDAERGSGVVAAKTVTSDSGASIVVNGPVALEREPPLIERLLAHEGGHVALHLHGEDIPLAPLYAAHSEGRAALYGMAAVALEEFRIERRLAELGYPIAERAAPGDLDDQLFAFCCEIFEAVLDPASEDPRRYATSILGAMHRLSVTLGYLAAPIVAGRSQLEFDQMSEFVRQHWREVLGRSWHARLQLYQDVPPVGTPYGSGSLSAHLNEAAQVEEMLLNDLGFAIEGGVAPNDVWSFWRTGSDDLFNARLARLQEEIDRRAPS
jgi:hypothetical protein